MMGRGKVFGNMTTVEITQQKQNSDQLDQLLLLWDNRESDENDENNTLLNKNMQSILQRITETLKRLKLAVTLKQMRKIVRIHSDMMKTRYFRGGITQVFSTDYFDILHLLPKTIELVYILLTQIISDDGDQEISLWTPTSPLFDSSFPVIDSEVYFRFLQTKKEALLLSIDHLTRLKTEQLSVVPDYVQSKPYFTGTLNRWAHPWTNIFSSFPQPFALGFFYFAIEHADAAIWDWKMMLERILTRLTWNEGAALLRAWKERMNFQKFDESDVDQQAYEKDKVTATKMREIQKKITDDLMKGIHDVDYFPVRWIEYYVKIMKRGALADAKANMASIERHWLTNLLKEHATEYDKIDITTIQERIIELDSSKKAGREGYLIYRLF